MGEGILEKARQIEAPEFWIAVNDLVKLYFSAIESKQSFQTTKEGRWSKIEARPSVSGISTQQELDEIRGDRF